MSYELTDPMACDARPDRIGVFQIVHTAVFLILARLALVVLDFEKTAALVDRLSRSDGPRVDAEPGQVRAATYLVSLAAAFIPARILCLERSLVLYYRLRRDGVPVTLRLGARAYPFAAHAWVEHEGHPIDETPDFLKDFQPIFGLG